MRSPQEVTLLTKLLYGHTLSPAKQFLSP